MRSQRVKIENRDLEFQRSALGAEKVFLNNSLVSKKSIPFGSWHIFHAEENGEEVEYRVKSGFDHSNFVAEVFRKDELVYKDEDFNDRKWVASLIPGVVIGIIVYYLLR